MVKNLGVADRVIRIVLAVLAGWLYFSHQVSSALGIVLLVIAILLLLTTAFGVCPAYLPFKLSTRKQQ